MSSVKQGNLAYFLLATFKSIKKDTCKPQKYLPIPPNVPMTLFL